MSPHDFGDEEIPPLNLVDTADNQVQPDNTAVNSDDDSTPRGATTPVQASIITTEYLSQLKTSYKDMKRQAEELTALWNYTESFKARSTRVSDEQAEIDTQFKVLDDHGKSFKEPTDLVNATQKPQPVWDYSQARGFEKQVTKFDTLYAPIQRAMG